MEYFGYLASILIEFFTALGLMVVEQYTHSSCFSVSIFSAPVVATAYSLL
jgi:hypothetical protein